MQIGPFRLDNPLILAPMAGVTDFPFRSLCRHLGAAMTVSEMLTADTALWHTRKSRLRLPQHWEAAPFAIQIAGTRPAQMVQAAQRCEQLGAPIIDINMGCPAKKVCNVLAGSALLKDERLVGKILRAVVNAVSVPVTLKIRTGWDNNSRNAENIGVIAQDCGVQALTIHGRTRADRFCGTAEYATIRRVKKLLHIPVFANGDIDRPEKARTVLDYTGADGLLIGRASLGNPWIFQVMNHYLKTGKRLADPPGAAKHKIILQHLRSIYDFYGEQTGVHIARKHLSWYLKTDNPVLWQKICKLESADDQYSITEHFLYSEENNRGTDVCISNQNQLAA